MTLIQAEIVLVVILGAMALLLVVRSRCLKKGDMVQFRRNGTLATVLKVSHQKLFVEFIALSNRSGRPYRVWVKKSFVNKVR